MQKTLIIHHHPLTLDPDLPMNVPYRGRMHSPDTRSAVYMHYHDTLEVGICFSGSGMFYVGGDVHTFSEGDISVIAPGVVHIAQSAEDDLSQWQFIDLDPAKLMGGEHEKLVSEGLRYSGVLHDNGDVRWILSQLLEVYAEDEYAKERAAWLCGLLMTKLVGLAEEDARMEAEGMSGISAAMAYISMHYDEGLTIHQLAALCNRSVTAFRRSFERATGKAPFEYLYEVRVKAAINLLQGSDMPISEIAGRVGYPTLSSFNRHFHRITGRTPTSYRKDGGNGAVDGVRRKKRKPSGGGERRAE